MFERFLCFYNDNMTLFEKYQKSGTFKRKFIFFVSNIFILDIYYWALLQAEKGKILRQFLAGNLFYFSVMIDLAKPQSIIGSHGWGTISFLYTFKGNNEF